jgi:hypothetical protein
LRRNGPALVRADPRVDDPAETFPADRKHLPESIH